ncbi:unnamed protein product [Hydatigera taeniaeformis]|uniref:BPL/LPL catalytic domain-containing protein n=1 Tax=Hydatigena taeniaeformis TaxID=6205 RepID=A0A3P7GQ39_HYDTA|nr:unnamed protein product [Hydatigera taeniaeformis]
MYALSDNDWEFNVWQNSTYLLVLSNKRSVESQRDEIAKRDCYDAARALGLLGISCVQKTESIASSSSTTLYTSKPPDSPDSESRLNCLFSSILEWFRKKEEDGRFEIPKCLIALLEDATDAKVEIVSTGIEADSFSFAEYFASLKGTSRLGRHPFWSEEMSSNFTVSQKEKKSGYLPHLLAWIQHLPALAVFIALNEFLEECGVGKSSHMELRVKWPNDVYVVDKTSNTCTKISGVLASATCTDPGEVRCLVGKWQSFMAP